MEKPNIIFILADDMGYGDFSYFNGGLSSTPVLDGLINEGICLTQHYSASPVCAPARASLLTGRYPHRTGAIDTLQMNGLDRLSLREITIADVLKANGYITGLIGKWHLGAIEMRYHPTKRGFDEFVGFRGGWQDYYKWHLWYNHTLKKSDGRYLTDVFTHQAIDFIKRHKKERFFLHLCYNAPHFPLQAPDEVVKPFIEKEKFTKGVCYIYGMIKRMDEGIGEILQCLKEEGLEKNTVIFFTSDNGPQFGGKGEWDTTRFNYNFNGCKGNVYEGGIRVPMIIKNTEIFPKGKMINEIIHFVDWFPTILNICGIKTPENIKIDGENVLPVLKGEKIDYGKRFWQWNRLIPVKTSNIAMRDGKWKLLKPPISETMQVPEKFLKIDVEYVYNPEKFTDIIREPFPEFKIEKENPPQLYNIEEDPFEKEELSRKYPEIVERMEKEMNRWFEEVENERKNIKE